MTRIDTHLHAIPDFYRDALRAAGIDAAGGRALPDWSVGATLETMSALEATSAILSVSTPGTTFLSDADDAGRLAARLNDLRSPGRPPHDGSAINSLLFGSAPPDDAALVRLADDLDQLEQRLTSDTSAPPSRDKDRPS